MGGPGSVPKKFEEEKRREEPRREE